MSAMSVGMPGGMPGLGNIMPSGGAIMSGLGVGMGLGMGATDSQDSMSSGGAGGAAMDANAPEQKLDGLSPKNSPRHGGRKIRSKSRSPSPKRT